jgi:hypothetical protein
LYWSTPKESLAVLSDIELTYRVIHKSWTFSDKLLVPNPKTLKLCHIILYHKPDFFQTSTFSSKGDIKVDIFENLFATTQK